MKKETNTIQQAAFVQSAKCMWSALLLLFVMLMPIRAWASWTSSIKSYSATEHSTGYTIQFYVGVYNYDGSKNAFFNSRVYVAVDGTNAIDLTSLWSNMTGTTNESFYQNNKSNKNTVNKTSSQVTVNGVPLKASVDYYYNNMAISGDNITSGGKWTFAHITITTYTLAKHSIGLTGNFRDEDAKTDYAIANKATWLVGYPYVTAVSTSRSATYGDAVEVAWSTSENAGVWEVWRGSTFLAAYDSSTKSYADRNRCGEEANTYYVIHRKASGQNASGNAYAGLFKSSGITLSHTYNINGDGTAANDGTCTLHCQYCNAEGATVHDWGEPVWTWSADGTTATATFTCKTNNSHKATPEVTMSNDVKLAPTCVAKGVWIYTASVNFNNSIYTAVNDVDIPATGKHTLPEEYDTNGLKICAVCHNVQECQPLGDKVDDYYEINNAGQYKSFATMVNSGQTSINGKLTNDIDITIFQNLMLNTYKGTLDGDGHKLTIDIDRTGDDAALIRKLYGTVRKLTVAGTIKTSASKAASIAANAYGCTISQCTSLVDIVASSGQGCHGGFIADVYDNRSTIDNCHFAGSMSGSANVCGGFIYACWSGSSISISNSLLTATFSMSTDVRYTFSNPVYVTVSNCYYTKAFGQVPSGASKVTEAQLASGEIAWKLNNEETDGTQAWYQNLDTDGDACPVLKSTGSNTVYCSYEADKCIGTYNNTATIGAPVHDWGNPVWTWSADGTTATATFTCQTDNRHKATPEVTITNVIKTTSTCGVKGIMSYTATTTFNNNTYTAEKDVDIPATGNHVIPAEYDKNGLMVCSICHVVVLGYQPLGGKVGDYYEIHNAGQLYSFAQMVNGGQSGINGRLTDDIDMSIVCHAASGGVEKVNWTPIGTGFYKGTFDGDGHTISHLYFDDSNAKYAGLFGHASGATIRNVGLVDVKINGGSAVGGVCGSAFRSTISNCYATGTVSGYGTWLYIGGVCGAISTNSTISNCYATGTVSGGEDGVDLYIGGVCGQSYYKSTITNCYSTANISGSARFCIVGGVCGKNETSTITNCYTTTKISGSGIRMFFDGGICGSNESTSTITNCYTTQAKAVGDSDDSTETNVEGDVSTERFQSGEIAYLLNGSRNEGTEQSPLAWGQNLEAQSTPVLSGEGSHYARTMANLWGTLVLPYDVTIDEKKDSCDFYTVSSVSDGVLSLNKMSGTLAAGTPVIIRRNGAATGVDIKPATPAEGSVHFGTTLQTGTSADGFTLTGTYAVAEVTDNGYIMSNNAFWKASCLKDNDNLWKDKDGNTIASDDRKVFCSPFRAYLAGEIAGAEKILLKVVGDKSFTIADVRAVADILLGKSEVTDISLYDIDGQSGLDIADLTFIIKCLNEGDANNATAVTPGSAPAASDANATVGIMGE